MTRKVMLLAAGRGERMRPLTEHTPKPLLQVAGEALIVWHIRRLVAAGLCDLVINISHLGEQIRGHCGDGSRWGANIIYSEEAEPLETAGGVVKALSLLGDAPFLVVNSDIWTDFPYQSLAVGPIPANGGAHLVLVDNPDHHTEGDFGHSDRGYILPRDSSNPTFTYSGIGVYTQGFFTEVEIGKHPLLPLLERAIRGHKLTGQTYSGSWVDVGTPERLEQLNRQLANKAEHH